MPKRQRNTPPPPPQPKRPYRTPPEQAKAWGVTHEHVLRLIHAGELAAFNVSTGKQRPRYLISLDDVAEFERRRSTRPIPESPKSQPSATGRSYV